MGVPNDTTMKKKAWLQKEKNNVTRNTHTHKHKEHSQLSKQHKKALSLIPNIVNVDSTPTIIIVRAASRLYVDKRSIILGIRIDFIKLYTLSLHDGFRRA